MKRYARAIDLIAAYGRPAAVVAVGVLFLVSGLVPGAIGF